MTAMASPTVAPMSAKSCNAYFANTGKVVRFGFDGYGSTKETVTGSASLQEYRNGKWYIVSTVTGSGTGAAAPRKTFNVTGGYNYRVVASCTAGGVTKSGTSATKYI